MTLSQSILEPPPGIPQEIWAEAFAARYWAAYHIVTLSQNYAVLFGPKWHITYIGPIDNLIEFLYNCPKDTPEPAPAPLPETAEELLTSLGL